MPFASSVPSGTSPQADGVEKRVLDYIIAHDGTISLSQAAQDLAVTPTVLQLTIDRLKKVGLLNQP
jgi:DNA-binding MarR family transcriptional regulator